MIYVYTGICLHGQTVALFSSILESFRVGKEGELLLPQWPFLGKPKKIREPQDIKSGIFLSKTFEGKTKKQRVQK